MVRPRVLGHAHVGGRRPPAASLAASDGASAAPRRRTGVSPTVVTDGRDRYYFALMPPSDARPADVASSDDACLKGGELGAAEFIVKPLDRGRAPGPFARFRPVLRGALAT